MPIGLNLAPELRIQLIKTAQALYSQDEMGALRSMNQVSALSPHTEKMIYRELSKLAGKPTQRDFGRTAFKNLKGRTALIRQKIHAVETVLSKLVHNAREHLVKTEVLVPQGAVRVKNDFFFDCGFDPRFSEDGTFYLGTPSRSLYALITTVREVIATLFFKFNAYFSCDHNERCLRQLILSCAEIEKKFSSHTYNEHMISSYPSVRSVPEHTFFERISDLFKALFPDKAHPQRLFPSELLHAIHAINKPQNSLGSPAEWASPFNVLDDGNFSRWDNGDLDRSSHWGLFRLCEGNFSYSSRQETKKLDRFKYNYVPHYLMIHAIQKSSKELKTACRALRKTLSEITIDMDSATSLEKCKHKLSFPLQRVKQCWDSYTQSHELLTEVESVFSQKDHYAPVYEAVNSSFANELRKLLGFGEDSATTESNSMKSLIEAYTGPFRNTRTGKLLAITG